MHHHANIKIDTINFQKIFPNNLMFITLYSQQHFIKIIIIFIVTKIPKKKIYGTPMNLD